MQIKGIDMDKTAIKRIENSERYVYRYRAESILWNLFRKHRIFIEVEYNSVLEVPLLA